MADPLTFALTQPELAARLVALQQAHGDEGTHAAEYAAFFESVPLQSRADAHEFAILTRVPVVWTQSEHAIVEEAEQVRAPGFVRCWLEGEQGWRILGASGPVSSNQAGAIGRFEARLDVAAPSAAHGFPVMVIVEGEFDLKRVAKASAEYLAQHGLLDDEIARTFLLALFIYLAPQLEELVSWFRTPGHSLRFGKPTVVRAFKAVGLEVLDYPIAPQPIAAGQRASA